MRTSLNEIAETEKFLQKEMQPADALVFEAKTLSNPLLKMNVFFQEKVYAALQLYHRKKLKEEAAHIHQDLFSSPAKAAFRQSVYQLFKK